MAKLICPDCGGNKVKTAWHPHRFPFGVLPYTILLNALVPVRECPTCNFKYLDCEAENIIDAKVKEHIDKRDREDGQQERRNNIQRGIGENTR